MGVILKAEHLDIGYRRSGCHTHEKFIHHDLSFHLSTGELVSLIGPNGVGKSTLLRTISCLQPILNGQLFYDGLDIKMYSERERSRMIGVVLTDKSQIGGLTVDEVVSLGRQPYTGFFGRLSSDDNRIIDEAILSVGIAAKRQSYMAELSDGERQKVMIAKALVQECPLIILDEPTAFLDIVSRIEIMTLLHKIAVEQNKSILLSTHDIEQALTLSDRLWLMSSAGMQCGMTEDMVLSGVMDNLFGDKDIHFDKNQGFYYPTVRWKETVMVKASSDLLLHWTINALNRKGYACLSETDTDKYSLLYVDVVSSSDIRMTDSFGKYNRFFSFEELLDNL